MVFVRVEKIMLYMLNVKWQDKSIDKCLECWAIKPKKTILSDEVFALL